MTMDTSPASLRDAARAWGATLLASPPWSEVADRVTLLVVSPPLGHDDTAASATLWLAIDAPTARLLPPEFAAPLGRDETVVHRPRTMDAALAVFTDAALHRLLQAVTPVGLEARWLIRRAEAITDRLHRLEEFQARANLLPAEAPERIARGLWLDLVSASLGLTASLATARGAALPAAGETLGALLRLAVAVEDGAHPPVAWLAAGSAETRIGRRLRSWIDDLAAAVGGDEAAARRVLAARQQALDEVAQVLGERWRGRPWLQSPEAYLLRAPR